MKNVPQVTIISTVLVRFLQGSTWNQYSFFTDQELEPNDIVVVDTANGPALARVEIMEKHINPKATKWVIQRVDMAAHEARVAREKLEKELKKKMEKRRKAIEDEVIYQRLAEQDDEMRELLSAYEQVRAGAVTIQRTGNYTAVIPPKPGPHVIQCATDNACSAPGVYVTESVQDIGCADPNANSCHEGPAWDNHGGLRPGNPFHDGPSCVTREAREEADADEAEGD